MTERLTSLELLRFLAALLVVLFHLPTVGIGEFGVDIFFIISGYVMMLSTAKQSDRFLLKRLVRIVPLYWAATLAVFLIALWLPSLVNNTTADPIHLLKSMFFIPFDKYGGGHLPLLTVGWTLNFEMYFYLLFSIGCVLSRRYRAVITTALLVIMIAVLGQSDSFLARVYSDAIVLEFAFGLLVYLLMTADKRQALLLSMLIALGACFESNATDRYLYYGLPAALLVLLAVNTRIPAGIAAAALPLGALSYALYLSHPYVIRAFEVSLPWLQSDDTALQTIASALVIAVALVSAHFIYKYLEQPVLRYLRQSLLSKAQ